MKTALYLFVLNILCMSVVAQEYNMIGKWYSSDTEKDEDHDNNIIIEFKNDGLCEFESIWINHMKKYYDYTNDTCTWKMSDNKLIVDFKRWKRIIIIGHYTPSKFSDAYYEEEFGEPLHFVRVKDQIIKKPGKGYETCTTKSC